MAIAKSPAETYLKIVLPKALKEQFKMLCWAENKTITDYLIQLMTITVRDHQELIEEVNALKKIPEMSRGSRGSDKEV